MRLPSFLLLLLLLLPQPVTRACPRDLGESSPTWANRALFESTSRRSRRPEGYGQFHAGE